MRKLVITEEHEHVWRIENSVGQSAVGATLEHALVRLANIYGIAWSGGDISSGFAASEALDTLLGPRRDRGQIHTGVVSA